MPTLTLFISFQPLSKNWRKHELLNRRGRHRAVSPAARHPDLWGDRRGDTSLLPTSIHHRGPASRGDRFLLPTQEKHHMNLQDYILDALEIVSSWDLPEEDLADAVNQQALLMRGLNPDDIQEALTD